MTRLQIVGGGNMGEALVAGLLAAEWAEPADITIVEQAPARRDTLRERLGGVTIVEAPVKADGTVIAVKPVDADAACAAVRDAGTTRVLSIAAGVTTAQLEGVLGDGIAVVRAMPNTPALVRQGAAAIAAGSAATDDDLAWAEGILDAVGVVVRVPESQLDAVTGLSGSGPAYVLLLAEVLVEAGVQAGLSLEVTETLVRHTLLGAARLLVETGDPAPALRAAVTSPGGTTAEGIRVLEENGFPAAVIDAVRAATRRSRELGKG
jgi:pyrroline-5-carboxylate reductase